MHQIVFVDYAVLVFIVKRKCDFQVAGWRHPHKAIDASLGLSLRYELRKRQRKRYLQLTHIPSLVIDLFGLDRPLFNIFMNDVEYTLLRGNFKQTEIFM